MRRGKTKRPTSSRSSPRVARASRRWSTNGSSGCRPTTIAAPRRCWAGRSTARARRSARPRRTNFSTGRWTSSASRSPPPAPAPKARRSPRRLKAPRAARARRRRAAAARPRQQQGQLKDQGLRALLRRFAADAAGRGARPGRAHQPARRSRTSRAGRTARRRSSMSTKLSDEAGAALLRDNGVWGTDAELARRVARIRRPSAGARSARELPHGDAKRRHAPARSCPRLVRRRRQSRATVMPGA